MEKISKKHIWLYVFTFILFMIYLISPLIPVSYADIETNTTSAHEVAHFFTHQLIRDKNEAFKSTNKFKKYFENDLLTHEEFYNFINEMWQNGYTLVDIDDVVINVNGKIFLNGNIDCNGRKPMLLSFDDMSFDLQGGALSDKLIVDENGKIASVNETSSQKFEYDKESIPILENFIEKQMNWEYYMGRIYQEASGHIMIDFVNDIGRGADNPNGVFCSIPLTTNDTLDEYFGLIFKESTDFSKLDSVLTKQDVANVNSSKEANKIITEKVYNATLKVVIDDIHKLKSMTIGHDECYLPYKNMTPEQIMVAYNIHPSLKDEVVAICKELKEYNGLYSPTLALAAINATHLNGFTDVRSSMSDGSFFKKYFNSEYIQKTFGNTDKIEESGLFYQ